MKHTYYLFMFIVALILTSCEPNNPKIPEIKGVGAFSISFDNQVTFAPSNLVYNRVDNKWQNNHDKSASEEHRIPHRCASRSNLCGRDKAEYKCKQ